MRRWRTLLATVMALLAVAVPAGAGPAEFTYSVERQGTVDSDLADVARQVEHTLSHPRGWSLGGRVRFRRVDRGGDFRVVLAAPAAVAAAHPVCDRRWSCRVGDRILVNDVRWRRGAAAWTGSLRGYRHYLVNHEVGHWLGFGHVSCPRRGAASPVMAQQSKTLDGCRPSSWPGAVERAHAAASLGVRPDQAAIRRAERQAADRAAGRLAARRQAATAATPSPPPLSLRAR